MFYKEWGNKEGSKGERVHDEELDKHPVGKLY